jgi:protein-tyrosine phosphatase
MADSLDSCQWIDLLHCDDPRDVVHQSVACLARGGLVGLATESEYVLAASALSVQGLGRLKELGGARAGRALALLLKGPEESTDWAPGLSQVGRRLAWRLWPGPLKLIVPQVMTDGLFSRLPSPIQQLIAPDGALALCSSGEPFLRDVLELSPAPLVLAGSMLPAQDLAVASADPLRGLPGIDMVIDSGPTHHGRVATEVRVDDEKWAVQREGVIDTRTLTQMSGLIILFVCTGNTCRSPMAEAICKLLLARRLRCSHETLEERGYVVLSAGVAAMGGSPAATHAIDVLRAMGGSLESHRSRRVTLDIVRQADCIFAMTTDHLEALLDVVPDVQSRAFLLDPRGRDVPDPVGSDHHNYRQTAQMIEQMLEERLCQMGL